MEWEKFHKRFEALNEEQKDAVVSIDGPTLVIAGPGSGKTEILSLRVANILKERDVLPQNILCLTFTDSAAINMRKRLFEFLGEVAYKIPVYTFHSFAVSIINKYPEFFYKGASFEPLDEISKIKILESILSNLKAGSKLSSFHPKEGFVYLRAISTAISSLKRAALLPEDLEKFLKSNEGAYKKINKEISSVFAERIKKDTLIKAQKILHTEKDKKEITAYPTYIEVFNNSLKKSIEVSLSEGNTKALSAWKSKWLSRNEEGDIVLKSSLDVEKLELLTEVFRQYQSQIHSQGYFDFDDMLIDVVLAIRKHKTLRFLLAETFEYVLIDEFQDTNDAQFSLVREIFKISEEYFGKPNIMAVGDDDQAIYKFQGAEVSNILNFMRFYPETKLVVLKKNYRSTEHILSIARKVILQGENRLENTVQEIQKDLIAIKKAVTPGILFKEFSTKLHEHVFITHEIKKLHEQGVSYDEIAIIGRKHTDLVELIPHLHKEKIPVNYERQVNILSLTHIREIITMATYAEGLIGGKEKDELLPVILSYEFWGMSRLDIWKISKQVHKNGTEWLEEMKKEGGKASDIVDFLLEVAAQSKYKSCDEIIDYLIGSETQKYIGKKHNLPVSPFREFYFGTEKLGDNQDEYIHFLSSLRVFIETIRAYKSGKELTLSDLVEYVELHDKNNLAIYDNSKFIERDSSVTLLTAHKAKGLEYKVVFILNCQEHVWFGRGIPHKISFPENLPILPAGDDFDDKIRLFYVALTRAKENIYFLSYNSSEVGKEYPSIEFLKEYTKQFNQDIVESTLETTEISMRSNSITVGHFDQKESAFLSALGNDYVLNVTHLNNYLDISKNGPEYFFRVNFLRFPQAKTPDMAFGSAIHKTIQKIYLHLKREGKIPTEKQVVQFFELDLFRERLSNREFQLYREKGELILKRYYNFNKKLFRKDDFVEFDFSKEMVRIGEAQITGKIDRIELHNKNAYVVDLKTGKTIRSFEKAGVDFYKIKKYRRQLLFYKLLIEGSSSFGGVTAIGGKLEFVEETNLSNRLLELEFEREEIERLILLVQAVYKKIKKLDFPSVEDYPHTEIGYQKFEEDLIEGKV